MTYYVKPTDSISTRLREKEAEATGFEGRSHNAIKRRNGGFDSSSLCLLTLSREEKMLSQPEGGAPC